MLQVNSDWFQSGTPQELEDYIGEGRFKYIGPGLYLTNNQTILVVANEETDNPWKKTWPEGTTFTMYVWDMPIHQTILSQVVLTRLDERE